MQIYVQHLWINTGKHLLTLFTFSVFPENRQLSQSSTQTGILTRWVLVVSITSSRQFFDVHLHLVCFRRKWQNSLVCIHTYNRCCRRNGWFIRNCCPVYSILCIYRSIAVGQLRLALIQNGQHPGIIAAGNIRLLLQRQDQYDCTSDG